MAVEIYTSKEALKAISSFFLRCENAISA